MGSTGSIGKSLINILKNDKNEVKILLLTTNKNYIELLKQVKIFRVKNIIITNKKSYLITKKLLKNKKINIYNNFDSINRIFIKKKIDYTMSSISGFHGLLPTLKIIKFSKKIAIANKESIICGWNLIKNKLDKYKTKFVPVDSEHFSIWSLINNSQNDVVEKVFITASGGPFINLPLFKFKSILVKDALKHPNWKKKKKISIDSATMMNKVFEVIEAKKIFNFKYSQLKILVHTQSYIHALVKFTNGLTKILIHDTDMPIPIFNSLYSSSTKKMRIINELPLRDSLFETVLVSANDALVELFLNKKIKFTDISKQLLKVVKMKEFNIYKLKKPMNMNQINKLSNYVSLKIYSMSI